MFALSVIVDGTWLAAANRMIEPVILSTGAAIFASIRSEDRLNSEMPLFINLKSWFKPKPCQPEGCGC